MKSELQALIEECNDELEEIESYISELPILDKRVHYLTNYALIRASGVTEFVYRSIVADHFSILSNSRIDTYLDTAVRKGSMSATYDMMCTLLKKFDDQWNKDFKAALNSRADKDKLISASNSLVTNRHSFAHGRSPSASFSDIKNYYFDVLELVKIFDSIVR